MTLENTLRIMGSDLPNYDEHTGIFYGVISSNNLNPEFLDEILFGSNTRDLSYEEAIKELHKNIDDVSSLQETFEFLKDYFNINHWEKLDLKDSWDKEKFYQVKDCLIMYKNGEIEDLKEYLEDNFNDHYECDSPDFLWESEGYKIINCLDFDLMILKSPYYTFAPECSPCVPCAGNLDSIRPDKTYSKKTYCLHPDFYQDEDKPKYKIYRVKDDKEVD